MLYHRPGIELNPVRFIERKRNKRTPLQYEGN